MTVSHAQPTIACGDKILENSPNDSSVLPLLGANVEESSLNRQSRGFFKDVMCSVDEGKTVITSDVIVQHDVKYFSRCLDNENKTTVMVKEGLIPHTTGLEDVPYDRYTFTFTTQAHPQAFKASCLDRECKMTVSQR